MQISENTPCCHDIIITAKVDFPYEQILGAYSFAGVRNNRTYYRQNNNSENLLYWNTAKWQVYTSLMILNGITSVI